jgi:RNA polymerase sigma-70 factor (ECF subfamily)
MTRPTEDGTVLDSVRRGDARALEELYRRHSSRLYALLLRMLREAADAEEVLQETFVDAWRRAREYAASRGSVEAWLITIARSRAIDRIRNRGARLRLVKQSEQLASAQPAQPEPPDVHAQTRLRRAYWDGLSQSEISRETGDPLGTVKTRVRLGLQRLAELLAG